MPPSIVLGPSMNNRWYSGFFAPEACWLACLLSNSKSPQFIGEAVTARIAGPHIILKIGRILVAEAFAQEYDFKDVDGKPSPHHLAGDF